MARPVSEAARRWALPLLLLLAAMLRVWHLVALRHSPLFDELQWDAGSYDRWAREIADGRLIGAGAFWQDPLYAYVLGFLYRIFGYSLFLPRLLAIGCGVVTTFCAARTAERVWGSRAAGLIAALIASCYLPEIHYGGIVGKTALSVCLLAAALDAFTVGSEGALLAAGALLGLGTLARGNLLLLLPLSAIALYHGWEREPAAGPRGHSNGHRAALMFALSLPVLSLATLHNYLASHELVPVTTNLGINLYLANHEGNEYGFYTPPPFLPVDNQNEIASFRSEAERRTGESFTDKQLSSYWTEQAWLAVRSDVGHALKLTFHKLELLFHDDEVSDADGVEVTGKFSPVLRLPLFTWGEIFPLAVLGAWVGFRRRSVWSVIGVSVVYLSSLIPFFVLGRLRIQLLAPLSVLAAGGIEWLLVAFRALRLRSLAPAGALLAGSLCVSFYRTPWMADAHRAALAVNWNNLGQALAISGKTEEAVRAYSQAVAIDARVVPASLRALGAIYEQRSDFPRALSAYQRLVELRPQSPSAQAALHRVRERLPELADAQRNTPRAVSTVQNAGPQTHAGAPPVSGWAFTTAGREKFLARLALTKPASLVWILFDGRDSKAVAFAEDLARVCEQAGLQIAELREAAIPLRAGVSLFASDQPTATYTALADALTAAGFEVRTATGYREFLRDKQRENPSYPGLPLRDSQEFVLVVGRQPSM